VKKILYWKARLNLHRNRFVDETRIASVVGVQGHLQLAKKIADLSITVLKDEGLIPIDSSRLKRIVNLSFQKKDRDTAPGIVTSKLEQAFGEIKSYHFRRNASGEVYKDALNTAEEADIVIVSVFNQRNVYRDNGPLPENVLKFLNKIFEIKPKSSRLWRRGILW